MGIYSGIVFNEDSRVTCETAEGYNDMDVSAQVAMIEGYENNLKLFEGGIVSDIQEAAMQINGVDEGELMFFSENVLTDMLGKIKSMLMKLWAKIKAIFKGFMARVDSIFMKSGKSLVNKYKSVILKKDMTDFEAKWRKPKDSGYNISNDIGTFECKDEKLNMASYIHGTIAKDKIEKWDEDKEQEEILKQTIKGGNTTIDLAEYEKDFMDSLFEDEDVDDKIDIDNIMTELTTFKDTKKGCEKANNALEKSIKNMVKAIEKDQSDFIKGRPGDSTGAWNSGERKLKKAHFSSWDKTDNRSSEYTYGDVEDTVEVEDKDGQKVTASGQSTAGNWKLANGTAKDKVDSYGKALQVVVKYAHTYQTCATKFTAVVMKAFKFHNSQLRRVFAKAVAYNRKKDESVMMEAFADLVEYEGDVVEEAGKSKKKKAKGKKGKGRKIGDEVDDGDMDVEEESYNFLANIEFK